MMSWIWRSPPPIENPWGGSDSGVLWYLIKRAGDSFWCDPISYQIEFTFAQSPIRLNWLRVTQSPIKLKSYGTQSPIKLIGETLSMYMYMYQRKASNLLSNWRVRVPNLLSNVIDLGLPNLTSKSTFRKLWINDGAFLLAVICQCVSSEITKDNI